MTSRAAAGPASSMYKMMDDTSTKKKTCYYFCIILKNIFLDFSVRIYEIIALYGRGDNVPLSWCLLFVD